MAFIGSSSSSSSSSSSRLLLLLVLAGQNSLQQQRRQMKQRRQHTSSAAAGRPCPAADLSSSSRTAQPSRRSGTHAYRYLSMLMPRDASTSSALSAYPLKSSKSHLVNVQDTPLLRTTDKGRPGVTCWQGTQRHMLAAAGSCCAVCMPGQTCHRSTLSERNPSQPACLPALTLFRCKECSLFQPLWPWPRTWSCQKSTAGRRAGEEERARQPRLNVGACLAACHSCLLVVGAMQACLGWSPAQAEQR